MAWNAQTDSAYRQVSGQWNDTRSRVFLRLVQLELWVYYTHITVRILLLVGFWSWVARGVGMQHANH